MNDLSHQLATLADRAAEQLLPEKSQVERRLHVRAANAGRQIAADEREFFDARAHSGHALQFAEDAWFHLHGGERPFTEEMAAYRTALLALHRRRMDRANVRSGPIDYTAQTPGLGLTALARLRGD